MVLAEPTTYTDAAIEYAHDVVSGRVDACQWVKLADQRTSRLGDADVLKSILDRVGGLLELLTGQGRGVGANLTNFLRSSGLSSGVTGGVAAEFGGSKGDITINLTVQGDVNGIDDLSALAVQAVTEARAAGASV